MRSQQSELLISPLGHTQNIPLNEFQIGVILLYINLQKIIRF